MDEEISLFFRLGVMFCMIAGFLSCCLNIAKMSTVILTNEANRYGDARVTSGSAEIMALQSHPRNYFDIIRIKHEQEELINSIILESADGSEVYVLYLRSSALVQNEHTKDAIVAAGLPTNTMVKEDNIDENLNSTTHKKMVQFREEGKKFFLKCYPTKDGHSVDIYGEIDG